MAWTGVALKREIHSCRVLDRLAQRVAGRDGVRTTEGQDRGQIIHRHRRVLVVVPVQQIRELSGPFVAEHDGSGVAGDPAISQETYRGAGGWKSITAATSSQHRSRFGEARSPCRICVVRSGSPFRISSTRGSRARRSCAAPSDQCSKSSKLLRARYWSISHSKRSLDASRSRRPVAGRVAGFAAGCRASRRCNRPRTDPTEDHCLPASPVSAVTASATKSQTDITIPSARPSSSPFLAR